MLHKGKQKAVWEIIGDPRHVAIEIFDDITAGDGEIHTTIQGKRVPLTKMICNLFILFERKGLFTHFLEQLTESTFLAYKGKPYPLEVIARGFWAGSYRSRKSNMPGGAPAEGTLLEEIVLEANWKNDNFMWHGERIADPLLKYNEETGWYDLYHPKKPDLYLAELPRDVFMPTWEEMKEIFAQHKEAYIILRDELSKHNLDLWDMKGEYGRIRTLDGIAKIVMLDGIDIDCCRIREKGHPEISLDKDDFRKLHKNELGAEEEQFFLNKYLIFAKISESFVQEETVCA